MFSEYLCRVGPRSPNTENIQKSTKCQHRPPRSYRRPLLLERRLRHHEAAQRHHNGWRPHYPRLHSAVDTTFSCMDHRYGSDISADVLIPYVALHEGPGTGSLGGNCCV